MLLSSAENLDCHRKNKKRKILPKTINQKENSEMKKPENRQP